MDPEEFVSPHNFAPAKECVQASTHAPLLAKHFDHIKQKRVAAFHKLYLLVGRSRASCG